MSNCVRKIQLITMKPLNRNKVPAMTFLAFALGVIHIILEYTHCKRPRISHQVLSIREMPAQCKISEHENKNILTNDYLRPRKLPRSGFSKQHRNVGRRNEHRFQRIELRQNIIEVPIWLRINRHSLNNFTAPLKSKTTKNHKRTNTTTVH